MTAPTKTARVGPPFQRKGSVAVDLTGNTVTVRVDDPTVTADSVIVPGIAVGAGLDSDELELDPVVVGLGVIEPLVGFDVVVAPASDNSEPVGSYLVNYLAW